MTFSNGAAVTPLAGPLPILAVTTQNRFPGRRAVRGRISWVRTVTAGFALKMRPEIRQNLPGSRNRLWFGT